jgi:hypothetical protein
LLYSSASSGAVADIRKAGIQFPASVAAIVDCALLLMLLLVGHPSVFAGNTDVFCFMVSRAWLAIVAEMSVPYLSCS